jgi:alpha-L-fucosidase
LPTGTRGGSHWLPAECDVSIRPGWFWHEKENDKVKSAEQLLDLYFKSVGRGASFLLNVPPDRRGLLHDTDVAALKRFNEIRQSIFGANLARGARIADAAVDCREPVTFNVVRVREDIRYGQRVDAFAFDTWNDGEWHPWAEGTSIGACRILSGKDITASRMRVRVTKSAAPPLISEIGLFHQRPI